MTKKRAGGERRKETAACQRVSDVLFEVSSQGILISDPQNRIVKVNPAFTAITGYSVQDVLGKEPGFLSAGRHDAVFYESMWDSLSRSGAWEGEVWNRRKNGETYPEWLSISAVKGEDGSVESYVAVFSDISKRRQNEEGAGYQVDYDALTGLPNRRLLQDRTHRALERAKTDKTQMAVLYIDLDSYRDVNNSLGLSAGDTLLVELGGRVNSCLRDHDTVGRLGGDKFLVVLNIVRSTEEVAMVICRLQEAISKPLLLKGQETDTMLSACIGAAIYPNDGKTAGDLIRNADTAVFHAKKMGRNSSRFFTEEMNARALERLSLEKMLCHGLENGEFVLLYQPKVNLRQNTLTGVEALLRWVRPGREELQLPETFISMAEETGMIIPLGEWVLKTACEQAKAWSDAGTPLPMAVNLSTCQIAHEGLLNFIDKTLKDTGLDPSLLELEITETALMEDAEEASIILNKIHDMGVKLAADDFGTGYSSLSFLRNFPLDVIKIDGSFVADINRSKGGGNALVSAIISIGQCLGLKVIAEGVENEEQLTFLRQQCCDEVQGFIFSRPVLPDKVFDVSIGEIHD